MKKLIIKQTLVRLIFTIFIFFYPSKKLIVKQTLVGLIFTIFIFFYPSKSENLSEAYFFPRMLAFIILFFLLLHWCFYFLKKTKDSNIISTSGEKEKPLKTIIFYFITTAVAILLFQYLGFYLTSFLFYLAIGYYYRITSINQKKRTLLISALLFVLIIYCVFALLLKVQTPSNFSIIY